jgi:hypothetical protein
VVALLGALVSGTGERVHVHPFAMAATAQKGRATGQSFLSSATLTLLATTRSFAAKIPARTRRRYDARALGIAHRQNIAQLKGATAWRSIEQP